LKPLAERLRPTTLSNYIGQTHLVGEGAVLRRMIESRRISSFIGGGPPGGEKTPQKKTGPATLDAPFYTLSAVTSGVKEVREVISQAKNQQFFGTANPILFIDEIHRFSKSQQDSLLAAVETGEITLIGATTENPSFEVIRPLLSRCQVYVLQPLNETELLQLVDHAIHHDILLRERKFELKETEALVRFSGGDARKLLNILELLVNATAEDATIVIESADHGGALITARLAGEYNRTVCAFPGRTTDKFSEGCLHLIRQRRAELVTSATDVLELLNWIEPAQPDAPVQLELFGPQLTPDQQLMARVLQDNDGCTLSQLMLHTGFDLPKINTLVFELEMLNCISLSSGNCYRWKPQ